MRNTLTKKFSSSPFQMGFTLIELLMVIILIGILSVGVQSLFTSKDAYFDYVVKERILSLGLLAQQMALAVPADPLTGPAPTTMPATLTISQVSASDQLNFTLTKHGTTVQSFSLEGNLPAMTLDTSPTSTVLSDATNIAINWDSNSNKSDATNNTLSIVGSQNFNVCFSASGYVYEC